MGVSMGHSPKMQLFPHIFVWGSCFWFCTPAFSCTSSSRPPPSSSTSSTSHTQLYSHTLSSTCHHNNLLTHTHTIQLTHHTTLHTQLYSHNSTPTATCPRNLSSHNLSSYILLTHNSTHTPCRQLVLLPLLLVHTTCHHTTCHHTTYSHTTLLTNLVVNLSSQNLLTRNNLVTSTCSHNLLTQSFHVAGVVLGDIDFHFAWQAWHLWHWTGSGGALGSQLTPWLPRLLAWQAWHLETSSVDSVWQVRHLATCTCILRGRRGTYGTGLSAERRAWVPVDAVAAAAVCVAGVVLGDIERRFCVAGAALGGHVHTFWVASVALGDIERRFCVASVVLGDIERRFCVAGVALMEMGRLWLRAWVPVDAVAGAESTLDVSKCHACHPECTYMSPSAAPATQNRRSMSPSTTPATPTPWPPRLFAWQAWYLATSSVDSAWQAWHLATSTCILRGRRGTYGTGLALQSGALGSQLTRGRRGCWRGRRGTWRHRASILRGRCGTWRHVRTFWVASVALGDIERRFCVAGVVLGDIERRFCVAGVTWQAQLFAWQAWYLATSSVDSAWRVQHLATCTCILRGRRGTYGTGLALVARSGPS